MILKSSRQTPEHKLTVGRFSFLHFTANTKSSRAKYAGFLAVIVSFISLVSAGIDLGTAKANGLPVIQKSGTLSSNEIWDAGNVYLVNTVTVPSGITLTLEDGVIVKYRYTSSKITVESGGTLNANGTATEPVIFTSYKDDTVGGDTNGDGTSSSPAIGNYAYAIQSSGGTVNVLHSVMQWATAQVRAEGASTLSAEDSEFTNTNTGIDLSGVSTQASLKRNHFAVTSSSQAISIFGLNDVSGIVLAGDDKNTFAGNIASTTIFLSSGAGVASGKTWTVSGSSGATLNVNNFIVNGTLDLQDDQMLVVRPSSGITVNGTLNLDAGTVVKLFKFSGANIGIKVNVSGTLNVNGTATEPVIFTSFKDDTAGGDTNGDGTASSPAVNDYSSAVQGAGILNLRHSVLRYATHVVMMHSGAIVTVEDSKFTNAGLGIELSGTSTQATLKRNLFAVDNSSNQAIRLSNLDVSGVVLAGDDKNIFTGTAKTISLQSGASVASGKIWTVSGSGTGAKLEFSNISINGTLNLQDNTLVAVSHWGFSVNGTLDADAGTIFKFFKNSSGASSGITVNTGGTLNANGTATNRVIFTSYKDDSVGGDTNGDGASNGAAGDYTYAITATGSAVNLRHSVLRYTNKALTANSGAVVTVEDSEFTNSGNGASLGGVTTQATMKRNHFAVSGTAISTNFSSLQAEDITVVGGSLGSRVEGGKANFANTTISGVSKGVEVKRDAQVTFRGSFENITTKAIEACNWDQDCAVDAAYVDWGSADGPAPAGSNPLACGQVAVSPWVHNSTTYNGQTFTSQNCDGSATPYANMNSSVSHFQQRISLKQIDCSNGFQDACQAIQNAMACLGGAMSVAQSTAPWTLPPTSNGQQIADFAGLALDGASTYITSQASVSVSGFNFAFIGQLVGLIDTFGAMRNAYSSCAP